MKILLLSRHSNLGASSRLRSYQYLPWLRKKGFSVTIAPLFDDDYLREWYAGKRNISLIIRGYISRVKVLRYVRQYDLVWIEKEIFPWLPHAIDRIFLKRGPCVVVDYDDAVFHQYDRHYWFFMRRILGRKIDAVMRQADCVVVGNRYLAQRAQGAGARRIEHIPTVIDLDRYKMREPSNTECLRVAWIGTPITVKYLDTIGAGLATLARDVPMKLHVIGAKFAWPGLAVEHRPWSEDTEVNEIQKCDIGIMPLIDSPFERGKCGYKLIQYMACGLPVVASPLGVNEKIIQHAENGYFASSVDDWVAAFRRLANDLEHRLALGVNGRRRVEESYCLQVTAPRTAEIFAELVAKKRK